MKFFYFNDVGDLVCEKYLIRKLTDKIDTPFYVYSTETILDNYLKLSSKLSRIEHLIAYSVKANSNISIIKLLASNGAGADIVSGGELKKALLSGVEPKKIVFSGVGKKENEISYALDANILNLMLNLLKSYN